MAPRTAPTTTLGAARASADAIAAADTAGDDIVQPDAPRETDTITGGEISKDVEVIPDVIQPDASVEVPEGKAWTKGALIIVGAAMAVPEGDKRMVIVVQTSEREDLGRDSQGRELAGSHRHPAQAPLKASKYAAGADAYFRLGAEADFGKHEPVVTVGVGGNVSQVGTAFFAERAGLVHVGPASPAYAAANLAYTHGARKIEIVGLSEAEAEALQPWIDQLEGKTAEKVSIEIV